MIYRSEWFDRDGIPAPKTWDDIYNAAVHFTDQARGIYGLVYPANSSSGNVLFNTFLGTNGSGVWTEDGKNPDWINPKNVEAIKFIRKLRDAGALPPGLASYEVNEVVQLALQDSVAMAIITGGSAGAFFVDAEVENKWKVLDVPMGPSANGNQGYVTSIEGLHAYNQTDTPDETKKALKWWAENYFDLWKNKEAAVNGIPVRADWLNDQSYLSTMADPFMAPYIKASFSKTHTLIFPATNISGWLTQNSYDAERWWTALSQAALVDPRSPEEVLQEWQNRALQIMKDFGEASN
jgi:multiple sugar transport system substrate-binding protein